MKERNKRIKDWEETEKAKEKRIRIERKEARLKKLGAN